MIADIIQIQKSTFANIRLTNLSQVAELNSVHSFILLGMSGFVANPQYALFFQASCIAFQSISQ